MPLLLLATVCSSLFKLSSLGRQIIHTSFTPSTFTALVRPRRFAWSALNRDDLRLFNECPLSFAAGPERQGEARRNKPMAHQTNVLTLCEEKREKKPAVECCTTFNG